MKQVKFNLDNLFRLSSISAIQTFEFENNSAEILISTDVKDELAYELHIENSEGKSFVILDKGEKHISCILTSGMLKVGVNKIQLRGIGENDYIIESNSAEFIVRSFINANVEPTPEEQTAFERLVVKVNIIETDVEGLKGDVDGINRELENKADKSDIPTKTSELENDSDFITSKDIPTVPTKTSQLTNDSGFITSRDIPTIPTKTSQLENDSEFVTKNEIPAVPTKTSQLENDSGFVTQQELDSKMEFYKLDYVGGALSHDGVVLNYAQIIEKFNDNKYFLYAEGDGFVYIPTLPPLPGDEIIEFSSSYIYGGKNYMSRIIINSENQVKWEEIEVVRATDFSDLQSEVKTIEDNKVSAITDENKSSTENYPSNKAMTDYVEEHGGSGAVSDVQINGTSILVDGVANIPVASADVLGVVKTSDFPSSKEFADIKESVEDLWLLSKDISYKVTNQLESGMNVAPKGMFAESLLDIRGKSEQKSTNGYQLFTPSAASAIINGVTFDRNDDGSYHCHGTATATVYFALGNFQFEAGKTYKLVGMSVQGVKDLFTLYVNSAVLGYPNDIGDGVVFTASTNTTSAVTLTVQNGKTIDFVLKPMISTNTNVTVMDFEPYTGGIPSPNPDYPQPISSVEEIHFDVNGVKRTIIPPFALNGLSDVHDYADVDKGVWFSTYRILTNVGVVKQSINKIKGNDGNEYWSIGYSLRDMTFYHGIMGNAFKYTRADKLTSVLQSTETSHNMSVISAYGHNNQFEVRFRLLVRDYATVDDVFDFIKTLKILTLKEPTETPISATDLDYLKSLQKLKDNSVITITDQNGNDISFLMEYIIKLSEVN